MPNVYDINDVSSEAGVIASAILNPAFVFYSEQLTPHHFTNEANAYMYYAICQLARKDIGKVDAYNITNVLHANSGTRDKADEVLSVHAINDFIANAPSIARTTVEEYRLVVDNVLNAALRRETYNTLVECQHLCFNSSEQDIQNKVYSALDGVMMKFSITNEVPQYKEVVGDMWEAIKARQRGETPAIEFPFPSLSDYVVMEPGEVVCFSAPMKAGKSAMLLTCAVDLLRKGKSVLYIDSELSTKLFTLRILSHLTKIKFGNLRSGNYSPEDERKIEAAVKWLETRNFMHIYLPAFDENTMYLTAKKAKHTIGMDCIIVDYLKATSESDDAYAVYSSLGRLSNTLKNSIAGDMNVCGITAAQATASGKIADSAKIARHVSTVISIIDKSIEEIEEDGPACGTKKMVVRYNRNGAQMSENEWIDMEFDGSTLTYSEATMQHAPVAPY